MSRDYTWRELLSASLIICSPALIADSFLLLVPHRFKAAVVTILLGLLPLFFPILWICSILLEFRALRREMPHYGQVVPGFSSVDLARQPALRAALPECGFLLPICFLPTVLMTLPNKRGKKLNVILGFPLLSSCSLEDVAILAKYHLHLTVEPRSRLHAYAHRTHRAALAVLKRGSVPFRIPALKVVVALTEPLARGAEAYACKRAGVSENALGIAQGREKMATMHFADYFKTRFFPLIQAGALPPLAEGFRDFLIEKDKHAPEEPAYRSIDSLWLLERKLVERGLGKEKAAELNAMSWTDSKSLVLPRLVERAAAIMRPHLKGRTVGDLPDVAETWHWIAFYLMRAKAKGWMPDVRRRFVGDFVNYAVAHALTQSGWQLAGSPDHLILRNGDAVLETAEPVRNLFTRVWAPAQFRDWAERMHVAAVPL